MGLTLVGGVAGAVYGGAFTVVVQTTVDPAALGRVFSIYGSIMLAPAMFGLLQTGFIADRIGIINVFLITGARAGPPRGRLVLRPADPARHQGRRRRAPPS